MARLKTSVKTKVSLLKIKIQGGEGLTGKKVENYLRPIRDPTAVEAIVRKIVPTAHTISSKNYQMIEITKKDF